VQYFTLVVAVVVEVVHLQPPCQLVLVATVVEEQEVVVRIRLIP
jgi:hypothetical protein